MNKDSKDKDNKDSTDSKDTVSASRAADKKSPGKGTSKTRTVSREIMNTAVLSSLLSDAHKEKLEKIVRGRCNLRFIESYDDLEPSVQDIDILIGIPLPDPMFFGRATRLKWVQSENAGIERYIEIFRQKKKTVLTNASGAYGRDVSEYMLTYVLMLLKNMKQFAKAQDRHEWQRGLQASGGIADSNVTVVGFGDIGGSFAKKMSALGAHVRAVKYSRSKGRSGTVDAAFGSGNGGNGEGSAKSDFVKKIYTKDQLDKALEGADIVALCLPDTAKTAGIMNRERIFALKQGAILVNVGRGTAIDQSALCDALREKRIYAALDVTTPEPLPQVYGMWDFENLIITPHISGLGASPFAAQFIGDLILRNMAAFLDGRPLENVVDIGREY